MIAMLLTLMCLFFVYVDSENSTTVWVMIGVIALVWFIRMIWVDDARSYNNFTDYWARGGPDRKKYPGAGAFVPRNVRAVTAFFQEDGFILTDLDYPAVGRRCVYFMPYSIKNTTGREIPVVTLTAYPAEVTESVQPAYGPGDVYDVLKKAETAKNGQMMYRKVILEAGTEINVFFEMNGWAYAEFQCVLGLVRAWVPTDCVR